MKANQVSVDRGNQSDRVAEINSSVNNFYSLPKRKVIKPPSSKYEFRLNDIKRKEMNRTPKKPTVYNDKNFLNIEEEENPEDEEEEEMLN